MPKRSKKKGIKNYLHAFALPWCCILPIAAASLGAGSGALAALIAPFTPIFLAISIVLIGYANYNVWFGKFRKSERHKIWVFFITIFATLAWLWSAIFVMRWITI